MQTVQRLINQFVPINYKLLLNLNRLDRTFNGISTIQGTTQPGFNSIILHSKDLNIESIVFDDKNADFSYSNDDTLIINHPDINTGKHTVTISFSGKITDSMHGLYPCYYEFNGIKKELLATQFESHYAREVFPCIDEPAAKATFDVTLITENNITLLGNMPIKDQFSKNNKLTTTFETTPIMSSYLLAWVVGDLHKKSGKTKSGTEVNIWATPAQPDNSLDFALDIAIRSIDFYNEYFDTAYPLPKSDHVALPDFSSGAMENWGLVTYREMALLADPKTTSISSRHYIASVIAHELSHQWFGNLVTMEWWNDLWLNESFATLIEYIAIDELEPTWNMWQDFNSHEVIISLRRDSLDGVQPVQMNVNHPDEIDTLFDSAIVYAKGARLLQMLYHYIGEKAFRAGLKEYFRVHAYKNTSAHDLWLAFKNVSNKEIESFMNKWISQPGFPVLHVSQYDNKILLSQNRLANKLNIPSGTLWPIPLNSNDKNMPELLETRSLTIEYPNEKQPLRFNVGNYAHFITHYDSNLVKMIIEQLDTGNLNPIDRLQLLNEQHILANIGIISNAELIPLLNSFKDESIESIWNIISSIFGELIKIITTDETSELKLQLLAKKITIKQYDRLGWNSKLNEPEEDTKLRSTILGLMLFSEDPDIISFALKIFHSTPIENLNPELRIIYLTAAIRHENKTDDIDNLIRIYQKTDLADLKQDICAGLTSTRDEITISKLLDLIQNTSIIRTQDTARWIIYLIRNKYSRIQTWQWIRDNWEWINKTFSGDKSLDEYPRYIATALSTPEQLDEYMEFFKPMQTNLALNRVIEIGINEIKNRIDMIERDSESVKNTLLNLVIL
jgi:aminopeptidase N